MKKILVLGAGKMGAWLIDSLCTDYDVAVYEKNVERLKYLFNCQRLTQLEEIKNFNPEMVINSVSLQLTVKAFEEVLPYISESCLLAF